MVLVNSSAVNKLHIWIVYRYSGSRHYENFAGVVWLVRWVRGGIVTKKPGFLSTAWNHQSIRKKRSNEKYMQASMSKETARR
jgi:hypothetical protein